MKLLKKLSAIALAGFFPALCILAILSPETLLAQGTETVTDQTAVQKLLVQAFGTYFLTEAAFGAIVATISGGLINVIGLSWPSIVKVFTAIGIAILLSVIGFFANAGIFAGLALGTCVGIGWRVGMGSNSIFDMFMGVKKLFGKK